MARLRTSMGRRKIEIRRIESEQARHVCFSKRRAGLFRKATELAILCGAEVAAVAFSPAGKAFSFGHPSVEAIFERFDPTGMATGGGGAGAGDDRKQLEELNRQRGELSAQLEAEKAKKKKAEAARAMAKEGSAASPVAAWLEGHVRDMGEEDLMEFEAALQVVQAALAAHANKALHQDALNHGRAMAASAMVRSSNNNQVQPPPPQQQRILTIDAGGNGRFEFAGNGSNNAAEMEMQIQQMMMAMTPPLGIFDAGMETLLQQGFGFPGPY